MAENRDWYPSSLDERADFHLNLANQAGAFAAKYGLSAGTLASIAADSAWYQFWAPSRAHIEQVGKQLTGYLATIKGNDPTLDPPATLIFELSGDPPAEVPPGIEFRTRALRRETVNSSNYAVADGLLLGFQRPEGAPGDLTELAPELALRTLADFSVEATFSKKGTDAVRFEFRRKGGEWQPLGDKASSPATLEIPPQTPGQAEQVEIRAIFLKKYAPVGNYSAIYAVVIAP